jgi:hypothetical protein
MPSRGRGALLAVLFSTSGCIVDGNYVIRGTVRAYGAEGSLEPVAGAIVETDGGRGGGSRAVKTAEDGSFALEYRFGGLLLPFLTGNSNPDVTFSAPGYQSRTARLKSDRVDPGISRRGCGERCNVGWGECCGMDAVLWAAPESDQPQPVPPR